MKTAFAYWVNRIAPVFDAARQIRVVEAQAGQLVSEAQKTLSEDVSVQKALRLVELGVGIMVCGPSRVALSAPVSVRDAGIARRMSADCLACRSYARSAESP